MQFFYILCSQIKTSNGSFCRNVIKCAFYLDNDIKCVIMDKRIVRVKIYDLSTKHGVIFSSQCGEVYRFHYYLLSIISLSCTLKRSAAGGCEENRNLIIGFYHTVKNPANRGKSGICSSLFSAGCGVF